MIYNGDTTGQDICTLSEKLSGTDATSFKIVEKTLYANMGGRTVWQWIFEVYGYQYDDTNRSELPSATRTLTANRQDYPMPEGSEHLMGVAYKDAANNWNRLTPITLEQIQERGAEDEFMNVAGEPEFYRPLANGFKIYPASSTSRAAALKVQVSRDIVGFTTADTDTEPGFDPGFHEAIATFMAMMKAQVDRLPMLKDLRKAWSNEDDRDYPEGFEQKIKKHYAQKFKQLSPTPLRGGEDITHEFE